MTSCIIGSDEVDLLERAHAVAEIRGDEAIDPEAYLEAERPNSLVGTVAQIRQQLTELEEIGVERVMLQYLHAPRPRRRRLHRGGRRELDGGGLAGAEPGEVGHPLAVIPWGAEHATGDAAALQPELEVVLPGEADAAEDLKCGGRDLPARLG